MKKILFSLAVVSCFIFSDTAQGQVVVGPSIMVDKDVHDYGDVPFGGDGTCEFKVTNNGSEPLIMSKCKGSCGCTVPKCDPNPILPGESSIITVKYDTKRPGPISKSVTITSNALNTPSKVVRIKGNVGPDPNGTPSGAPVKEPSGAPAGGN